MLVLLAMLNEGQLPRRDRRSSSSRRRSPALASRSAVLRKDLGPSLDQPEALRKHLERNPIEAWTGGRAPAARPTSPTRTASSEPPSPRNGPERERPPGAHPRARRLAPRRVRAERSSASQKARPATSARSRTPAGVRSSSSPTAPQTRTCPRGRHPSQIDGKPYEADFVKVAVNVAAPPRRNRQPPPGRSCAAGSAPTPAFPAPATRSPWRTEMDGLAPSPRRPER